MTSYGELDSAYLNGFSLAARVDWEDFGGRDITPLAQQTLTEIKKHYTCRVGIGIAEPTLRWEGLDITGFDYLQFSYYPKPGDATLSGFYAGLSGILSVSREIADKNGIKELIWGETGTIDDSEKKMPEAFGVGFLLVDTKTKLDFYNQIFEQTKGKTDGYVIDYTGFFGIKGHPAEKVVQKWFNSL